LAQANSNEALSGGPYLLSNAKAYNNVIDYFLVDLAEGVLHRPTGDSSLTLEAAVHNASKHGRSQVRVQN
jgi:hypothetical protein